MTAQIFTLANQLTLLRMLLIPAFVLLVVYGYFGLMPLLRRSIREDPVHATIGQHSVSPNGIQTDAAQTDRERRVRKLKASAGLAYWGVCSLLLVAAVFVAWLDLREISRNYVAERRAIWTQAADRIESTDDTT